VRHCYADARPSGTPRRDEPVTLHGGRRLQVAEWGPADGIPVLFLHGHPGSRLFCPDLDATVRAGVRLITFDRRGYGRSDPNDSTPTFQSSVADVVGILDAFGVDQAPVIGFSGGGPHVLACGALAADRFPVVTTVCSVSGQEVGQSEDPHVIDLERAVMDDRQGARDAVRARARTVLGDTTWVTRMTARFDPRVYDAPQMREIYQANWDEASAVSVEGYVDDWILGRLPWPFELADIAVPVFSWFGENDGIVSPSHGIAIAERAPRGSLHGCPKCRHYVPVGHWPEILEQAMDTLHTTLPERQHRMTPGPTP
jgi:pimeloyl-ACP methyl ester carboxylesterase